MASVLFALGLLAMLVVVSLAFYWQGTIRLPGSSVAYGVEDSIRYITPRLADETRQQIGEKSVRRILEWEMRFLQDQLDENSDEAIVLGGDAARDYVIVQTGKQGFDYPPEIVSEVMHLQAEYMESIGALAAPVEDDELEAMGMVDND